MIPKKCMVIGGAGKGRYIDSIQLGGKVVGLGCRYVTLLCGI